MDDVTHKTHLRRCTSCGHWLEIELFDIPPIESQPTCKTCQQQGPEEEPKP